MKVAVAVCVKAFEIVAGDAQVNVLGVAVMKQVSRRALDLALLRVIVNRDVAFADIAAEGIILGFGIVVDVGGVSPGNQSGGDVCSRPARVRLHLLGILPIQRWTKGR